MKPPSYSQINTVHFIFWIKTQRLGNPYNDILFQERKYLCLEKAREKKLEIDWCKDLPPGINKSSPV